MVKTQKQKASDQKAIHWLDKYLRYVNYLGAAQLYLKDNFLLRRPLSPDDIKDRILGHWGTVPGLNFIYAHLNYLICKHGPSMLYVAGPGHGAPAVLANLFAENTLAEYFPMYQRNESGTGRLIKYFSWPGGFPSHANPATPGAIVEGGELGYSLSTSYGAVLDNPDLIVACVVGDGEAETGPLAASWHSNKFLNPRESGAVLPILHANGYKITGPTIYGTMSDKELIDLFTGFGYEPRIVNCIQLDLKKVHQEMIDALEWAYQKICAIQKEARSQKKPVIRPIWPMLIVRSLKGWTGIKKIDGHMVEGGYRSHGIPVSDPKTNMKTFKLVKGWLENYFVTELVDCKGRPLPEILEFVPKGNLRMGMNKYAIGGNLRKALHLPDVEKYAVKLEKRGQPEVGNTIVSSDYIRDIFVLNKKEKNFRFMCPDETESNKFMSLFEVTNRAYVWPIQAYDENLAQDGRVMEILSEHTLQGWLEGYLLTGRHGIFATYEAFATIVASMVDQYAKFLKQSLKVPWRKPISSLNYLLSSVGWRQEHNGYSHQNPSFISNILEKHGEFCSVYFPPDANSLLVILEDCFKRTNSINVIAANKNPMAQWLTVEEARKQLKTGVSTWDWVDPKGSKNPDIVLAAAGDVLVLEAMAAISILKKVVPELKVRFVNVSELTALGVGDERHPLSISDEDFYRYFTEDRPIIFNFHGYPAVLKKLIFGHAAADRFIVHGYIEEGTTTTPFDMCVVNKTSRYHLVMDALREGAKVNKAVAKKAPKLIRKFQEKLKEHYKFIREFGRDLPEVENWKWE